MSRLGCVFVRSLAVTMLVCWVSAAVSLAQGSANPVGKAAPALVRADLSGKSVSLEKYRGKVVLLNFWATWCGPCLAELPTLVRWQSQFGGQGLQVIGVSMDDNAAPVRATYAKFRMDYPVVMGDEHIGEAYGGVLGVPVTFLINRQGVVVRRYAGPVDAKLMEAEFQRLMAARP